jgi:hypothetical protein
MGRDQLGTRALAVLSLGILWCVGGCGMSADSTTVERRAVSAAPSAAAETISLKWAFEDENGDGFWNYSETNGNLGSVNQWGDLPVSHSEKYQGQSSLKFEYRRPNAEFDWGFCHITTANSGSGLEPTSFDEKLRGKDVSSYQTLRFFIKGDANARLEVTLKTPNGHTSNLLPLARYATVTPAQWTEVAIPLHDFDWSFGDFNIHDVYAVMLYAREGAVSGNFTVYVDNLEFTKPAPSELRWAYEDGNGDGAWNYSHTAWDPEAGLEVANQWNDIQVTSAEKYEGQTSLRFAVDHRQGGFINAYLTTGITGAGVEALGWDDRNRAKDITPYDTLRLFVKGDAITHATIDLIETSNRNANPVELTDWAPAIAPDRWTEVDIPLSALRAAGSDFTQVREIWIRVTDAHPRARYTFYVDNVAFVKRARPVRFVVDRADDSSDGVCVAGQGATGGCNLRAALRAAAGASGPVTIELVVDASITQGQLAVAAGSVSVIARRPHRIDGNESSRLFSVASGAALTLRGLTISHFVSFDGGAIENRGTLALDGTVLADNAVRCSGVGAQTAFATCSGGAIANYGQLSIGGGTRFENNSVSAQASTASFTTSSSSGGAIVSSGSIVIDGPVAFAHNTASANSVSGVHPLPVGDANASAGGGAIYSAGGSLTFTGGALGHCSFVSNAALATAISIHSQPGTASSSGGAIFALGTLVLPANGCTFQDNQALTDPDVHSQP